jgi:diguanylate cyclase (GGDEF)-like protein/PAS domain S-box-containing protein
MRTDQPAPFASFAGSEEATYRQVVESTHLGIGMRIADGTITFANSRMAEMLGYEIDELLGMSIELLHVPEERSVLVAQANTRAARGAYQMEIRLRRKDGVLLWILKESTALFDSAGGFTGTLFTLSDITERKQTEALLDEREARFRGYFQHAAVGVARVGLDGCLHEVNPAFARLVGYQPDELIGRSLSDLVDLSQRPLTEALLEDLSTGTVQWTELEQRYVHRDGRTVHLHISVSTVPGPDGHPLYLATVVQDISARKAIEDELAHRALHDSLTGLGNRALLLEQIARALARVERHGGVVALLFFDLDQFKLVNDSLGHAAGDDLLVAVAERLLASSRREDSVARLGGDEFVVLCEGLSDPSGAAQVAGHLLDSLGAPFVVAGRQLFVTASTGVATTPAADADTLLREADAAMYQAKALGRNRFAVFAPSLHHRTSRQLRLASELHDALTHGELRLLYQPVVNVITGEVTALEALVRWEHPNEGLLSPDEFIPLAEDIGLISGIGAWATREACRQVGAWQNLKPGLAVHVNVSPHQLGDTFVGQVLNALAASGMRAGQLVLEITEQAVMTNFERSCEVLGTLRELGVRIAIDDFGTGYSSLAYLQNLPLDGLKVDQTFIQRLGDTDADTAIVTSVVSLAHIFGLTAIAEGVETRRQLATVRALGCDEAQGYFWSRPVAPELVPDLLKATPS